MADTNFYFLIVLIALTLTTLLVSAKDDEEEVPACDTDNEPDEARSENAKTEPSFCQEVIVNDLAALYNQDDFNILAALATSVLNKTYPSRLNTQEAFALYDEMPYPVPTGASTFFMILFTMYFTWYFTKFIHWTLKDVAKTVDLSMTEQDHFPHVNLYMLQQSRRESELNRDARNTWAWLANSYLLRPNDEFVRREEALRLTGWADFHVPRDVWGIIREVLKGNPADRATKGHKTSSDSGRHKMGDADGVSSDPGIKLTKSDENAVDRLFQLRKRIRDDEN